MNFDLNERTTLAGLADVLIPASEGFLSASAAGAAGEGLDQLLAVRPDLAAGLKRILQNAKGRKPGDAVKELQAEDSASFGVLAEVVPGAYFMNPQVRATVAFNAAVASATSSLVDADIFTSVCMVSATWSNFTAARSNPRPGSCRPRS